MNTKTNSKKNSKPTAAQRARRNAELKRFDAQIDAANRRNFEAIANALPGVVKLSPRIEWEIVSNYLKRNNRVMVDKDEQEKIARAMSPEYARLMDNYRRKQARKEARKAQGAQ